MPLVDPITGEVSNAAFALDTHAAAAGENSIFDSIGNIVTKGIPLTGLSIANSFYNTGVQVANFFGADAPKATIQDEVGDGSLLDYYKQHTEGIETAGLLVGSLLPGLGAIKVGSAAIKAAYLARTGLGSEAMSAATGLLSPLKAKIVQGAADEIVAGDAALFGSLKAQKTTAFAVGAADQALQGLVYSAATAATMHASPLLDNHGVADTLQDMFYGAVAGGLIGGVFEGFATRGLLNRMISNADNATKGQEISTRLGLGAYTPGDRANVLIDSLDTMAPPLERLGEKKQRIAVDSAGIELRKIIGTMTGKGNEDIAAKFNEVLGKIRSSPDYDKDALSMRLARLQNVSRWDGSLEGGVPTGDSFYLNSFVKDAKDFTWENLATKEPAEGAKMSLRYQMKPGATQVNQATFADKVRLPNGVEIQKYANSKEAFEAGEDVFLNANLKVIVNPESENLERLARPGESRALSQKEEAKFRETGNLPKGSAPLFGKPVLLNANTGDIVSDAIPTVGDLGVPTLVGDSLKFGNQTSQQGIGRVFDSSASTQDLNARTVWAAQRGIKTGDKIADTDIPMLEQLYREGNKGGKFDENLALLQKKGVSLADGTKLEDLSATSLLNRIRTAKDNLIAESLEANPKLGTEELALRANVSEGYITGNLKAKDPSDFMRDPTEFLTPSHLKLEYDIGSVSQKDGQVLKGLIDSQYRIGLIKQANQDVAASYFGKDYQYFVSDKGADQASVLGIGGGFLTSSNSGYGTLGESMERIGRMLTRFSQQKLGEVSEILAPHARAIRQDETAAAELGLFRAVRQRTGATYSFLPPEVAVKAGLDPNTAVLSKGIQKDRAGNIVGFNKDYIPENFKSGTELAGANTLGVVPEEGNYSYYVLSQKVADFERAQQGINDSRVGSRNAWFAAQGLQTRLPQGTLYTPPIDTRKSPFFAYVKNQTGKGMADDGVAVITARTAEELQHKISSLGDGFSVWDKDTLADFHKVEGEYQFSRNFAQGTVNATLEKKGILNNIYPDTRAETILKDYIDWNSKQEILLARDHVELGNAQLFAELRAVGERFGRPQTSLVGQIDNFTRRTVQNPYDTYIRTALGVSPKDSQYPLWAYANEKLEAFAGTAFDTVRNAFIGAQKGVISYEQASKMAEKFGLGNSYQAAGDAASAYYETANQRVTPKVFSALASKANTIMGNLTIRLDVWQQFIHIVSNPIMEISEATSAMRGMASTPQLADALSTPIPGAAGAVMPSAFKTLLRASMNYWDKGVYEKWMPIYKDLGIIRDAKVLDNHQEAVRNLALPFGRLSESAAIANIGKAADIAGKISLSDFTNDFLHFQAADIGRQIFEAAGYQGRDLTDRIATFVNRVDGNFVASQRPVAFQGPIGQAVGLFQTYYFNFMQQALRYVENGEARTIATLAGIQQSLFGLSSQPGFHFINNWLIGSAWGNPNHADLYSATNSFFDKDLGDFLMYGGASYLTQAGLFTRGDISPRQLTPFPVNPLDYPAVRGLTNFAKSMWDMTEKIAKGGDIPTSMLLALEHNGMSRPLSGIAQLINGQTTTGAGSLVSTNSTNTWSDLFSAANFSRLLGARPLDEAVMMEQLYKSTLYTAKDRTRIEALGEAVKTTLYGGREPTADQLQKFATEYAGAGGQIDRFASEMQRWTHDSNVSVANKTFNTMRSTAAIQNMQKAMGGVPLPDYANHALLSGGSTVGSQP